MFVDPLAEEFVGWTPYHYVHQNPINLIDPTGMSAECPDCPDGKYTIQKGDTFSALENKWGLDNGVLQSLNPSADPNNLQVGQSIVANTDLPVNRSFNINTTTTTSYKIEQPRSYAGVFAFAGTASAVDGPVPAGEIVGGIAILATAVYYAATPTPTITLSSSSTSSNSAPFNYVTYTKTNAATGQVYVGRSSGYGDPGSVVAKRDANHHMKGYGPAILSTYAQATLPGGYATRAIDPSYWAIRGSEQTQIDHYRGLGKSGNSYNGISPSNQNKQKYMQAAKRALTR